MPLVNWEISLNLKRSEYCVITYTATRDAQADNTEIRAQKHPTLATAKQNSGNQSLISHLHTTQYCYNSEKLVLKEKLIGINIKK